MKTNCLEKADIMLNCLNLKKKSKMLSFYNYIDKIIFCIINIEKNDNFIFVDLYGYTSLFLSNIMTISFSSSTNQYTVIHIMYRRNAISPTPN